MRLIFVRHGDAHAGFHGPIGGATGCRGLTDLGRRQAERLRDHLRETQRLDVDVVLTSEIPRAIETASIVAQGIGFDHIPQDCDLCEVHTGEADGVDWSEYPARFGSFDMVGEPDRPFAPGGDSWNDFHERVRRTMDRLAEQHPDRTVMAVCHAGVIAASLRIRLGIAQAPVVARLVPTHTGLTEWEFDERNRWWTLRSYNDARHLDTPAVT